MLEDGDQRTGLALGIAVAVAILVALLSIGTASFVTASNTDASVRPANAPTSGSIRPAGADSVTLYFALGEATLSDEARLHRWRP
jgi:hypothetical protein